MYRNGVMYSVILYYSINGLEELGRSLAGVWPELVPG